MAKIAVLEQKTYQGKPQGFKVTLDDGRNGNLEEKQSDKGLRVGDEVFVTEIPYTSKAGNKSTLFGLHLTNGGLTPSGTQTSPNKPSSPSPVQPLRPAINVGAGKSKEEMKAEATIKIASVVVAAFLDGKGGLTSDKVKETVVEFDALLWQEIEEIYGK